MKTFVKSFALLGLAGALAVGAVASQANARDAAAFTGANNASYYVNGAYAYETAPAYAAVPSQSYDARGHESFAYAPRSFDAPVRPDGTVAAQQRHLDGTE